MIQVTARILVHVMQVTEETLQILYQGREIREKVRSSSQGD